VADAQPEPKMLDWRDWIAALGLVCVASGVGIELGLGWGIAVLGAAFLALGLFASYQEAQARQGPDSGTGAEK